MKFLWIEWWYSVDDKQWEEPLWTRSLGCWQCRWWNQRDPVLSVWWTTGRSSLACDICFQMEPDKHAPSSEHLHFSLAICSLHNLPRTSATFTRLSGASELMTEVFFFFTFFQMCLRFSNYNSSSLLSFQRHKWDQKTLAPVGRKTRRERAEQWSNSRPGLSSCQSGGQLWKLLSVGDYLRVFLSQNS